MTGLRHGQPPATHDVRRESRRRLIVGISGLLAMLLLVLLVGLVTDRARKEADAAMAQAQAAGVTNPGTTDPAEDNNEPLADLGVAPSVSNSAEVPLTNSVGQNEATPSATGRVPDLQPDPQLAEPKSIR